MKKQLSVIGLLYSSIFFVSFCQSRYFTDTFLVPKHFYIAFVGLISLIVPLSYYFFKKYKQTFNLSLLDISLLIYFLYISINLLFLGGHPFYDLRWMNLLILAVLYASYKSFFYVNNELNKSDKIIKTIILCLLLISIIQSIYGLGQYFNIFKVWQSEYRITGAFGNPGPFANFLIVILPFSLAISIFYPKGLLKKIAVASTCMIIITLPFTAARAAWVATFIVVGYILIHTNLIINLWQKYFHSQLRRIILFSSVLAILVIGVWSLTKFKEDSASGRLFIWKVSAQMIKDKPLFGSGHASFPVVHNNYQAQYFRENPEDWDNAFLADGVNYAFNEYIQIASEDGVVGLILFLLIPIAVFRKKKLKQINKDSVFIIGAEGVLLAVLVSSLFSYPLQDISVLTALFFSLSILSVNASSLYTFEIKPVGRKILVLTVFVFGILFIKMESSRYSAEKEWLKAFHLVRKGQYPKAQKVYENIFDDLKYNQFFLFNYGAELTVMGEYQKSIDVLKTAEGRINDSDYFIYLGSSYEGIGDYTSALECFDQSSYIMPVKFYPIYRMVLLYRKTGENEAAKMLAKKILDMPIKVESDIVSNIRSEMSQFLQEQ